jgi:hypothetical protein
MEQAYRHAYDLVITYHGTRDVAAASPLLGKSENLIQ